MRLSAYSVRPDVTTPNPEVILFMNRQGTGYVGGDLVNSNDPSGLDPLDDPVLNCLFGLPVGANPRLVVECPLPNSSRGTLRPRRSSRAAASSSSVISTKAMPRGRPLHLQDKFTSFGPDGTAARTLMTEGLAAVVAVLKTSRKSRVCDCHQY